jgi:hypothetical protein
MAVSNANKMVAVAKMICAPTVTTGGRRRRDE